jgi:hypothetical protein
VKSRKASKLGNVFFPGVYFCFSVKLVLPFWNGEELCLGSAELFGQTARDKRNESVDRDNGNYSQKGYK